MALGASGMYQRRCALERPANDLFGVLWRSKRAISAPNRPRGSALARTCAKAQPCGQEKPLGNTMDQSLKSPGQSALDNTFHAMFELSRTTPAPALEERLDRLARVRAALSENEARFEEAISADFGHRCATETAIAETLLVLGEIKHAAKHLKKWMAPRRVSTALQFLPAKNGRIPHPLGVVASSHHGIIRCS